MNMHTSKQILIVDDDPNYIDLVNRALSTCQPLCHLKALSTGTELLDWLETNNRPSLIFLDINMPGSSGLDILKKLKTRDRYKAIPVVMLTVSDHKRDVEQSYDIRVSSITGTILYFKRVKMLKVNLLWP